MIGLFCFALAVLASPFKSKLRLEAENAVLQLIVLRRRLHGRVRLTNHDRWFFTQLYRWFPAISPVPTIIRPETLVRWHRAGFRRYWRWKTNSRGGRPQIQIELRALIRQNEHGESALGRATHSRRTAQARVSSCAVECRQIHGQAAWVAKPRMGAPFCVIMRRTLQPWTYSLSRRLASNCSMPS